jgi:hypothetical protein
VILSVFAFFSALGFGLVLLGYVLGYPELGIVGATIVLAAGGMVTTGGLEHKTGETRVDVDANETVVTHDYEKVETSQQFSLGILTMLTGGAVALRSLDNIG